MAGLLGVTSNDEVALVAATAKTVLQIVAASNHRVKILAWGVYFDGVSSTGEPVIVNLLRQTGAGTASAGTIVKIDASADETMQTTSRVTFTVEPTSDDDVLKRIEVHPQSGYEEACPFGQEYLVGGGLRVGIKCTAAAGVNARAWFRFEE